MTETLGVNTQTILYIMLQLLKIIEDSKSENHFSKNFCKVIKNFSNNHLKLIKIEGTRQAVKFYSFSIFNYLTHCINTKEALLMVNWHCPISY